MIRNPFWTRTVTGGIWLIFGVASAVLATFVGVLYWNLDEATVVARKVTRTEEIEREFRELKEDMLDAETGQRGYLLTMDKSYLAPYAQGVASVKNRLRNLHVLVAYPDVKDLLGKMEPVVDAKLTEMAQTIVLAGEGRRGDAMALVLEGGGQRLMDEFRHLADNAIVVELRLLAERQAMFAAQLNQVFLIGAFGGVAALALLTVTAARTARRLAEPVAKLLDGIRAVAQGDLSYKVGIGSGDEIGRIAEAFNDGSARLLAAQQAREAVQKELERSNADLDNFAYVASHDLKAPLRGIRNLAEWVAEDVEATASEETRENLRLLRSRTDRLDGLLEALLAYSRVGRKTGGAESVDTGKLVAEIRDYLAPRPGFTVVCADGMPSLVTPKAPLEQVLRNLINNALKHHDGERGRISVSAREGERDVEFRVEDDGPGIAPEFHQRIFQMFQTLKPRDQVEGSGMGLAIVKKTVENAGGRVRVESSPPQRGTAFVFSWPKNWRAPDMSVA